MGIFFNFLLFIGFFLPFKELGYFSLGPVIFSVSEFAFILLPIVYFFYKKTDIYPLGKGIRNVALFLLVTLALVGMLKVLSGQDSPFSLLKQYRPIVPFLSGLLILTQGLKINPRIAFITLITAILVSNLGAIVLSFYGISDAGRMIDGRFIAIETMTQGRFAADNGTFSILALLFLVFIKRRDFPLLLYLFFVSCFLITAIVGALTFNRTMLVFYPVVFIIGSIFAFSIQRTLRISFALILVGIVVIGSYYTIDEVQRQVDKRILSVQYGVDSLLEAGYYETREFLYVHYLEIIKNYWFIGSPGSISTGGFVKASMDGSPLRITDISVVTIAILFGLIAAFVFILFWGYYWFSVFKIFKFFQVRKGDSPFILSVLVFGLPIYFIMSLNFDLIARQQVVFVLLILGMLYPAFMNGRERYG